MDWQIKRRADLARGAEAAAKPASIRPLAYPGDDNAHEWVVTVTDSGAYVDLSGVTVTGYFYRHVDGATPFATGTVTGNTVSVQIPSAAYALGGYVTGILRAAKGDVLMTLDSIVFAVGPNVTGEIIDPGTVIQDIDALIARIDSAVESIPEDYTALEDDVDDLKSASDESLDISLMDVQYDTAIASNAKVMAKINDACVATFVPVVSGTKVKVGSLQVNVFEYEKPLASTYTAQSGYINTDYTVTSNGFIRLSMRKDATSSSAVTETDILSNIGISLPGFRYNRLNGLRNCLNMGTVDYYRGLVQSTGASIVSAVNAMFKPIPVDHDKVYYFRMTATESEAQAIIFAYDEQGRFVTEGRNNDGNYAFYTHMTSSATNLSHAQVIVFPESVKYISVMYNFATIPSISLETYMPASELNAQSIGAVHDSLEDLSRQCYYTGRNNKTYVDELINVAKSYYDQKDENDNYRMHYDANNTVLTLAGYNGNGGIDCSTYVGLILRGIPFDETEYATGKQSGGGGSDDEDADDGESGSTNNEYDANPDYDWSINPYDYDLPESPYSTSKRPVRSAAALAYWMESMGRRVWKDEHLANLLPGDVVFFARKDKTTDNWIQPKRYNHISHAAVITAKTKAPQSANWDTTVYPYAHEVYEVSGVPGACTFHYLEDIAHSGDTANGTDTLILIARPDLGHISPNAGN